MKCNSIELRNFRNIKSALVEFHPGTNVLLGANAQGKTNLIESIYLLACGKSFRTPRYRDLICHEQSQARVVGNISGEQLPFELSFVLDEKEGKKIFKNEIPIHKLSDFLGLFRVVLFCPEHLSLVKEGPGKRRSFIDAAICQLRPYYASLLNECNKTEAQRAALLKQSTKKEISKSLFSVWDERLAAVSVKIACIRADYVKQLQIHAPVHFERISSGKEALSLSYQSDVFVPDLTREEMETRYRNLLAASFETDQKYGFTGKGVHRDDLLLSINSHPAKGFASQGQQRSAVLSLKLAEGEISKWMTGKDPVYLLDDVLSELDETRRNYVTSGLSGKQVILTGTDLAEQNFADRVLTVNEGVFSR